MHYTHEGNTDFGITDHYGGREGKYGDHLLYSILSMYILSIQSLLCCFIQLCIRIYRKFVRHSLVSKVYDRAQLWLGLRKKFQNKGSQMAGKRYLEKKDIFLYSHNTYNDNYNTKSKGAWKYITTLRLTLNIETLNIQK